MFQRGRKQQDFLDREEDARNSINNSAKSALSYCFTSKLTNESSSSFTMTRPALFLFPLSLLREVVSKVSFLATSLSSHSRS